METRKITIVSTREQKKYVINSEAETLAQLKNDLNEAGIDYTDMTFMEGLTRTEILSDESLLPRDVVRTNRETGAQFTTNELVFMLTNTSKKIKSGMDRKECYDYVKSNGIQDDVKRFFGKNYTQVKTDELVAYIEGKEASTNCVESRGYVENYSDNYIALKKAIVALARIIDYYSDADAEETVLNAFNNSTNAEATDSPYSDDELYEMFRGI